MRRAAEANWRAVAADPEPFLKLKVADAVWLGAALPILLKCEEDCPTAGESLTHLDLRSDNVCDAPRVRAAQRRQLETALPWAARALDLPPLTFKG